MGNESEEDGDNYIERKATAKRMLGLERMTQER
jgi:hypothetical protein